MTRFVNAVLISVFAFFVFLGIFWQFSGDGVSRASPGGAPTVTAVHAAWQPESEREMLLTLTVHNPSSLDGRITAVSYEAEVEGRLVDSAVERPLAASAPLVRGKGDAPVELAIDLPDDFVLTWWPDYMAEEEKADLRIQGSIAVHREDADRDVAFEWRSSWEGDLAQRLSDAVANCGPTEADLCLERGTFFWEGGALQADLRFLNPGAEPVAIGNTSLRLLFADQPVVSGDVDVGRQLGPGEDGVVGLALTFSQQEMSAWWAGHLGRCERTPVALRMDLEVHPLAGGEGDGEGGGGDGDGGNATAEVVHLQWTFPASTFQTRFLCAP